jgi:hypothetical protein
MSSSTPATSPQTRAQTINAPVVFTRGKG